MPKIVFFNSIFDEIEEISYARLYQNIFDQDIAEFVSYELQERQIEENSFPKKLLHCYPGSSGRNPEKKRSERYIHHEKVSPKNMQKII